MPSNLDGKRSVPDPRLHPNRHRAASLSRDGAEVGTLYVEPDDPTTQTGHLWWRSSSEPREFLKLWITIDGDSTDGQDLDTDLENWSRGIFVFGGATYACTWLDDTRSAALRAELDIP